MAVTETRAMFFRLDVLRQDIDAEFLQEIGDDLLGAERIGVALPGEAAHQPEADELVVALALDDGHVLDPSRALRRDGRSKGERQRRQAEREQQETGAVKRG